MKLFLAIFAIIFFLSACESTPKVSKETLQSIIAERGSDDRAILVAADETNVGSSMWLSSDHYTCLEYVQIDEDGGVKALVANTFATRDSDPCDNISYQVYNSIMVLPAIKDGNAINSFGVLTVDIIGQEDDNVVARAKSLNSMSFANLSNLTEQYTVPPYNNIDDIDFNALQINKIEKSQTETISEFKSRRFERFKDIKTKVLYETVELKYDAELEIYKIASFCHYGYADQEISSTARYNRKSGTNGFGAEWTWSAQEGDRKEVRWGCRIYEKIEFPISLDIAKELDNNAIGVIGVAISTQEVKSDRIFEAPEYGKSISRDIDVTYFEGAIQEIYIADKLTGRVYSALR